MTFFFLSYLVVCLEDLLLLLDLVPEEAVPLVEVDALYVLRRLHAEGGDGHKVVVARPQTDVAVAGQREFVGAAHSRDEALGKEE